MEAHVTEAEAMPMDGVTEEKAMPMDGVTETSRRRRRRCQREACTAAKETEAMPIMA